MATNSTSSSDYVLYYHPYSVCSLMVLNTLVWKGSAKRPEDEVTVQSKVVDIFHEEQLSEDYLCNINDHGQVPVLAHPSELDAPITDSLKITHWLARKYPDLMPVEHEAEIRQYLTDLHALNYFSLSFPGRPQVAQHLESTVQRRLQDSSISDRYRNALEFKLGVVKRDKSGGLVPSVTAENQKNAKALLSDLEHKLPSPESWIYGENPTAIDAHLVVFIARMIDVGREQLIPEKLRDYTHWAMQKPEWVDMMGGRTTMIEQ